MSRASSPSSGRRYGTARVCQLWEVPRSTVYARRARASRPAQPAAKRGPKGAGTDAALTEHIRSSQPSASGDTRCRVAQLRGGPRTRARNARRDADRDCVARGGAYCFRDAHTDTAERSYLFR